MKRLTPDTRCVLIRAYFLTSGNYTVRRSFPDAEVCSFCSDADAGC